MSRLPTSGPALRRRIKLALLLEPAPGATGYRGRRHGRSFSTPELVPPPTGGGNGDGALGSHAEARGGAAVRPPAAVASRPLEARSGELQALRPATPTAPTEPTTKAPKAVLDALEGAARVVRPVDVWSVGKPTMKLDAIGDDPRVETEPPSAGPDVVADAATQLLPAIPVPPTARLNALDDWEDIADAVEKAMTPPAGSPVVDEEADD